MRLCTAKYEVHMQRFFEKLGYSIGLHPWRYIISLVVFTLLSTVGMINFNQINNARIIFTASDSRSHTEGRVLEEFLHQNGTLHMIEMIIKSADNGSLMRPAYMEQLTEITSEIANNLSVEYHGEHFGYHDLCYPYCEKNIPFTVFMELGKGNQSGIDLTYPSLDVVGKRVFIGNNVYNVTFKKGTRDEIAGFSTAMLRYFLVHNDKSVLLGWEKKLVDLLYESHKYPLLKCGAGSDNLVAEEVRAMGTRCAPLFGLALALLVLFLFICSFRYKLKDSKPLEVVLGGIIPLMSCVTTLGLVAGTGLAFQSIVVSTMFLLLAIGIDDVFVMLAAWHRTDKHDDVPTRIGEMVKVSGCSMTVTSITNFISFGNGVLSTTPVLQTFSIYSVVGSVFCFVYQLILFPAILALTAHREYKTDEEQCKMCCLPQELPIIKKMGKIHDRIWIKLAAVIGSWWMRIGTFVFLLAYWAATGYGIAIVETDLSIQKMAPQDARIVQFKNDIDITLKDMQSVVVIVTKPGDLRDPAQLNRIQNMIRTYEKAPYSYGENSTLCFLPQYLDFLAFYASDDESSSESNPVTFTYSDMGAFLMSEESWRPMLHVNETACDQNQPECIEQFIFTTGFTTVVRYNEMYPVVVNWREIADNFSDLGVYTYTERNNFADQSHDLVGVVWNTLLSEVICMGISFIVFVPDLISIFAAMFSLLSVNLGVFGFLVLWGIGIDPISMAALLMSIGFSVDISAHISYHYYEVKAPTAREKLEHAYLHIGWPTMQGALSTAFAVSPILLRYSYLGVVFFKTIVLVTVFGLLHGLVILPVLLSLFTSLKNLCCKSSVAPINDSDANSSHSDNSREVIEPHRISIKSFTQYKIDK